VLDRRTSALPAGLWKIQLLPATGVRITAEGRNWAALARRVARARRRWPNAELFIEAPSTTALDAAMRHSAQAVLSANPDWGIPPLGNIVFGGLRDLAHLQDRLKGARLSTRTRLLVERAGVTVLQRGGSKDLGFAAAAKPRAPARPGWPPRCLADISPWA